MSDKVIPQFIPHFIPLPRGPVKIRLKPDLGRKRPDREKGG